MKTLFPAVVDRAEDGTYGVVFPDVEGCSSAGDTLEEAVQNAEEALAQHLEVINEKGWEIPTPSDLEKVVKPDDATAIMLIPARLPAKAVRVNITMDEELLERIDAASNNRSAFLADAARSELDRREGGGTTRKVTRNPATGHVKIGKRKVRLGRRGRISSKGIVS